MTLEVPNVSLAACFLICGYLSYRTFTSPNPPPRIPYGKDRIRATWSNMSFRRDLLGCLWCYHTILILFSGHGSALCLNPDQLNPDLFSWSAYTTSFIVIIAVASPIRLLAYAQLGENFTFELAKPTKLISTGLYRYMQHPSYAPFFLTTSATYFFMLRLDGAAACVLPSALVKIPGLSLAGAVALSKMTWDVMATRVRDEEEMMQREFGKEWETYHRRTKRFIPGIF